VSVACWLIPFPLESFVKKPVPWTLISCSVLPGPSLPSAQSELQEPLSLQFSGTSFSFSLCGFPSQRQNHFDQTDFARNALSQRNRVVANSTQ